MKEENEKYESFLDIIIVPVNCKERIKTNIRNNKELETHQST
jgi:hypothetical protein